MITFSTLLRWSYHSLYCGHHDYYCHPLCSYYEMLLLLLESVIKFLSRTVTCTSNLILLNLSLIHNLKSVPCRNVLEVLT